MHKITIQEEEYYFKVIEHTILDLPAYGTVTYFYKKIKNLSRWNKILSFIDETIKYDCKFKVCENILSPNLSKEEAKKLVGEAYSKWKIKVNRMREILHNEII
jgi:hypothetical protein